MDDPYASVKPDQAKMDALWPHVRELARNHIARTQTDFLGRMSEAIINAEDCCPMGGLDEDRREEYYEEMIELAALAMAQAAMCVAPLAVVPNAPAPVVQDEESKA